MEVRIISSTRSMPAIRANASSGMLIWVKTRLTMIRPAPGTPAVPIEARSPMSMTVSWSLKVSGMPYTSAAKTAATPI